MTVVRGLSCSPIQKVVIYIGLSILHMGALVPVVCLFDLYSATSVDQWDTPWRPLGFYYESYCEYVAIVRFQSDQRAAWAMVQSVDSTHMTNWFRSNWLEVSQVWKKVDGRKRRNFGECFLLKTILKRVRARVSNVAGESL